MHMQDCTHWNWVILTCQIVCEVIHYTYDLSRAELPPVHIHSLRSHWNTHHTIAHQGTAEMFLWQPAACSTNELVAMVMGIGCAQSERLNNRGRKKFHTSLCHCMYTHTHMQEDRGRESRKLTVSDLNPKHNHGPITATPQGQRMGFHSSTPLQGRPIFTVPGTALLSQNPAWAARS